MKRQILTGAITAGFVIACCSHAAAQDASESSRLQKLEQAVNQLQQENQQLKDQIHTEVASEMSTMPAGKLDISTPVTSIQLFGELLIRYFVNEGVAAGRDAGDVGQEDRLRYRLRLGANIKVTDGWTMGVVLETNSAARSANVTLGAGGINDGNFAKGNSSTTTAVTSIATTSSGFVTAVTTSGAKVTGSITSVTSKIPGVAIPVVSSLAGSSVTALTGVSTTSGKALTKATASTATVVNKVSYQDALFVGQVFMKYQPFDWLTVEAGKFRPNLVSTRMIWDADICPEGFGENFLWHFGGDSGAHGVAGPAGYDKDGKETKMVTPPNPGMSFDLFANFAQYIYDDAGFENTFNTFSASTDTLSSTPDNTSNWLLGWQIGGKVNFTPTTYFQLAATYYNYTEGGSFSNTGFFNGDNALVIYNKNAVPSLLTFNQTSTNDLGIVDFPVEFGSKIGPVPFTVFGDFADNLYSQERAANAGHPDKGNEGIAWQAGLSIGQIKKKGDWEIRGWYQKSEQFALDPNIVDDDIFDGRLNMEGFYIKATYALADAVNLSIEYSNGHRIDSSLGTAGSGALGTAAGFPVQSVNLFYVNFGLKF
jgi:Putative porin